MARDAKGRIAFEMVSPGEAFQQHLEKHHNVSAVTPVWLDNTQKKPNLSKLKEKIRKEMVNDLHKATKQRCFDISR